MTNKEFKWLRWGLLLTQQQLADALGYKHKIRISEFERETNPVPVPPHIAAALRDLSDRGNTVGGARPWVRA